MKLNAEAEFYRSMTHMKVGSKIHIPQRQFIGEAPEVDRAMKRVADANFRELGEYTRKHVTTKK
jgi:hypothetical protein